MKKLLIPIFSSLLAIPVVANEKPNIIYILADDLGYGDVQCLNPERGKILTPHMDQLAKDGMTFTDAHTSSSVCTPTRYSVITGRYSWRTKLQRAVTNGYSPALITKDIKTVPSLLKDNGYKTAMIGKWHIGLGISTIDGKPAKPGKVINDNFGRGNGAELKQLNIDKNQLMSSGFSKLKFESHTLSNIDWKGKITGGPVDLGFESWYGITASLDFPPYVWIRDRKWLANGDYIKAFHRPGPASKDFEAIDVLDKLVNESVKFIKEDDGKKPFFAYIPLPSPHTPIVPTAKWQGKSGINSYADFVMQTDDFVGQIVKALDEKGISENTLLIVTSDNGCSPEGDFETLEKHGHFASAQYRGAKADIWEGGHRVPFFVKWPKVIEPGSVSDVTTCQIDLMGTCSDILGVKLGKNEGVDSESILPALKGEEPVFTRKGIIHHSVSGHFAYREGDYKLILAYGSGGWMSPKENEARKAGAPKGQLYDLATDPGETKNLYTEKPELVKEMLESLTKYVQSGSSVAGKESKNDKKITLWKSK